MIRHRKSVHFLKFSCTMPKRPMPSSAIFSCASRILCECFRHPAGFHARVILDGTASQLGELGDVRDVLGVLGDDHVVPIVLRVLE